MGCGWHGFVRVLQHSANRPKRPLHVSMPPVCSLVGAARLHCCEEMVRPPRMPPVMIHPETFSIVDN
jgi:hypothetical protein